VTVGQRSHAGPGDQSGHGVLATLGQHVMAERFAAQLLSGKPARSVTAVVQRLLAVQGQDPRGVRLAIRSRSAGLTAADVDRALTDERSLLITWLNRGTLHLVRAEDYWWLHALTTPQLATASTRRLAQEGVPPGDADQAVAVIEASLAADGPLTRAQLGERITAAGVRTEGQALVHILLLASRRGLIVRGPMIGADHAYVLVRDWLGAPPVPVDRDTALAELARRYLAGHGPAADRDLAKWAGLPLGDARRGLTAIAAELSERDDGLASLAIMPGGRGNPGFPPHRLLGSFDPLLHGWVSREPVLGGHQGVVTTNGIFRPFALVRGRGAATWSLAGGRITLAPFAPLTAAHEAALMTDAADVLRFLGKGSSSPAR
jgi:Winged helix DNA-binding domain